LSPTAQVTGPKPVSIAAWAAQSNLYLNAPQTGLAAAHG
jgi:hypothetical protein